MKTNIETCKTCKFKYRENSAQFCLQFFKQPEICYQYVTQSFQQGQNRIKLPKGLSDAGNKTRNETEYDQVGIEEKT